jgi:hypothetical protein
MLSPFWDDQVPAPAIEAVRHHLTGRPANRRKLTLVAALDPYNGAIRAPASLASQLGTDVVAFEPPDQEPRNLHAKLLLVESAEWTAALIGSSNATEAGLGLNSHRGHHELNVWLGCPSSSSTAKHLRSLARTGARLEFEDDRWEALTDEDEPTSPMLPYGFVTCLIQPAKPAQVVFELEGAELPASWEVRTPADQLVLDEAGWQAIGALSTTALKLPGEALPAYLMVRWQSAEGECQATWTANVDDRAALPPPAELTALPVEVLLAVLASTRPLPDALERELRRRERTGSEDGRVDLDPLHRFDDSGLLLQRIRHLSFALSRLQDRLSRPAQSLDALHWRLNGAFGPLAIADGLVRASGEDQTVPGEAHFLLAEMALTIAAVDWQAVGAGLDQRRIQTLKENVLEAIESRRRELPLSLDAALNSYVTDALRAASV